MAEPYTVQKIAGPYMRANAAGDVERYYTIHAQTEKGVSMRLDIPEGQTDPAQVKPQLTAKAKELDALFGL